MLVWFVIFQALPTEFIVTPSTLHMLTATILFYKHTTVLVRTRLHKNYLTNATGSTSPGKTPNWMLLQSVKPWLRTQWTHERFATLFQLFNRDKTHVGAVFSWTSSDIWSLVRIVLQAEFQNNLLYFFKCSIVFSVLIDLTYKHGKFKFISAGILRTMPKN
jgi:hypothetical protein